MSSRELKYMPSHEWIETEGELRRIGITDHAQQMLGDIVFLEFPEPGTEVQQGDELLTIESPKAAASVYAPVSGTITEVNTELESAPEKVNESPLGAGWLVRIRPSNWEAESAKLLDADAYQATLEEE